ncbi:MAG: type II toxin-antitoxin system HigB family toxin [Proteobacteria bacterium]|nr:type II toxin-antitoxin system HigB family toxin [Pseudomonadota bacterium]
MRIIAKRSLKEFWRRRGCEDSEQPLKAWYGFAKAADWDGPTAVKADFRNASIVRGNRVVFNIAGNKYRLIVKFNYGYRIGYVRFVGTHDEYDEVDAEVV